MQSHGLNQSTRTVSRPVRLRGLDPADLADWLEQVTPHLSTDTTLPFLGAVHIRLAAGRILAFATDRYTGAITTLPRASTNETAQFTIPGDFARQAITELRAETAGHDDLEPVTVDLTISDRIFGLTVHQTRRVYYQTERGTWAYHFEDSARRLAARIDPDGETLNLPRVAADALAAPSHDGPVHVDATLLARFLGYGITVPFNPATGHLLANSENLLARYAVHNTGRIIVLTRADYLGFIATCRTEYNAPRRDPAAQLAATRTAWRETLAAIA